MGRKVFVCYKYSDYESYKIKYRDILIEKLGNFGSIYKGEDGYSDDLSGYKAGTIKNRLKPMIHDSSITVVLLSKNITQSKWVDWEIHYSLLDVTRKDDGRSRMNGIIGIFLPVNGNDYSQFFNVDSCNSRVIDNTNLPLMIIKNRFNILEDKEYTSKTVCGKTYNTDFGSYISLYTWEEFINGIDDKLEIAYKKSREFRQLYDIKVDQD